ncbi:MAG: hypothetical protein ACRC5R_02745 [Mycoplasmatales bacterium]
MITKFISEVKSEVYLIDGQTLITSTHTSDAIVGLRSISCPPTSSYSYTSSTNSSPIQETRSIIIRKAESILTEKDIRYDFSSSISFGVLQTEEEKMEIERAVAYYYKTFIKLSDKAEKADQIIARILERLHTINNNGNKHCVLLNINCEKIVNPKHIEDYLSDAALLCDVAALGTVWSGIGPIVFEIASMALGASSMVIKLCKGDYWAALEEFVCLIPFFGLGKVGKAVFKGGGKLLTKAIDPLLTIIGKSFTPNVAVTLSSKGSKLLDKADDISPYKILRELSDDAKELASKNWKNFSSGTKRATKQILKEIRYSKNYLLYLKIPENYISLIRGDAKTRIFDAGLNISMGGLSGYDIPTALEAMFDAKEGLKESREYVKESLKVFDKNTSEIFKILKKGL